MKKRLLLIILAAGVILVISALFAAEHYTSRPAFCGSCHIMKKYYNSWKNSKHAENNVACIDCHSLPGEKHAARSRFKGLRQFLTYFERNTENIRKPSYVSDFSCKTPQCHPDDTYGNKKVKFTEKISYVHNTHEDIRIEGQVLHCDTCHQHLGTEKHFEVQKEACYLCHFLKLKYNKGLSRCSMCHEIPTEPLQKQKKDQTEHDEKTITHQSLEKTKVPCQSCHYELIQGNGKVKKERCYNCHEYSFNIETKLKEKGTTIMHTDSDAGQHVALQLADCFECHDSIQHQQSGFMDPVRLNCIACHPDHHQYQKTLLVGAGIKGVPDTPGLMYDVKTNCIGCHTEKRIQKGETVLHGSGKTCAACHTEKHEAMLKEWKDKVKEELKYAKEIEQEAEQAIEHARGKVSQEKLDMAFMMLREGQENVSIVEYGGGVHNKKYSLELLDAAMNKFEDLIELLQK
jgi:nitrate/TMAO reductase-like tetraheme cytochrome c subunit